MCSMNKTLFSAALLLAACVANTNAQDLGKDYMIYHSCDFSDGIPADYTTIDLDQQELHYTMIQGGIKQGEAWARKKETRTGNYFAASACRYKEIEGVELKPSDDWLITPAIWVRGKDCMLSWESKSLKSQQKEAAGYRVLISTTGNNPADFTEAPIVTISEESLSEWIKYNVDLSDYQGEHIYIAFHNNSSKGDFICVDNISVTGHRGLCDMTVAPGTHHYGSNSFNISLAFTSYSDEPITDMTLYYRYNGEEITRQLSGLNIATYEQYSYTFDTSIDVAYGDTVQYTVGAVVNGVQQGEIECSTIGYAFKPARCVVIEEATAMWCTFCPTGIVAMQILQEKYPDNFIGLALHYDDPIAVNDYVNALGFDGFPSAWVNRTHYISTMMAKVEIDGVTQYVADHGGMETYFLTELEKATPIDVTLGNIIYEGNQVNFSSTIRSAIDKDDVQYRLAFAVVENNVWQEGYYQKNGYSGDDVLLNGWEEKPSMVYDFAFNHVARAIYEDYTGVDTSVPTQLEAGAEYTTSYTLELPQSILTPGNTKIVAMIINKADGSIVNATESDLVAAINPVNASHKTFCYTTAGHINIALPSATPAHIAIYNTAGTLVAAHTTHTATSQFAAPAAGVYVVRIVQDNNISTHKIAVR